MFEGSLHGRFEATVTFMAMIALADKEGTVDMTPQALIARTGFPPAIIDKGLRELEAPDQYSRTPDLDGRRIIRLDEERAWGWKIVNYEKYRNIRTSEERRAYHRQYWYKRKDKDSTNSTSTQQTQPIAYAEAYAKAENTLSDKSDVKTLDRQLKEQAIQIIDFLNEKTGRHYRHVDTNIKPIIARLKSGVSFARVKGVVAKKSRDWGTDPKMEPYLRPDTLFRATKFENYLGELPKEEA